MANAVSEGKTNATIEEMAFALSNVLNAPTVEGRRDFLVYRDLGVAKASNGRMSAQTMTFIQGKVPLTGWHYHVCESQLCYVMKGSIDLEFEDGVKRRMKEGDVFYIPGGMKHNETALSDDYMYMEITVPANLGTVACEAPDFFAKK